MRGDGTGSTSQYSAALHVPLRLSVCSAQLLAQAWPAPAQRSATEPSTCSLCK